MASSITESCGWDMPRRRHVGGGCGRKGRGAGAGGEAEQQNNRKRVELCVAASEMSGRNVEAWKRCTGHVPFDASANQGPESGLKCKPYHGR